MKTILSILLCLYTAIFIGWIIHLIKSKNTEPKNNIVWGPPTVSFSDTNGVKVCDISLGYRKDGVVVWKEDWINKDVK